MQAVLHSRAPISLCLHDCRLRFPQTYALVHEANAHLRDLLLSPGQDVHCAYLIERRLQPQQQQAEAAPLCRSKMAVCAHYSWQSTLTAVSGHVRRHQPPQQQNFERYFQDSAMSVVVRPDCLRTFLVKAEVRRTSEEDATHTEGRIPAAATAVPPRDVDERGVVVGHLRNFVTDAYVGASLRLQFSVELSEEAQRELLDDSSTKDATAAAKRTRLRLGYEVVADAADWAISGFSKGTLEMKKGEATRVECQLVPIRIGMLACPFISFRPIDVRQAVSPRSTKKVRDRGGAGGREAACLTRYCPLFVHAPCWQNDVRWVGPRYVQIFPLHHAQSRYPVLKMPIAAATGGT